MPDTLRALRALSDPTRLRIMALLQSEELSVNELQGITRLGQSRISTHLGQLQEAGMVQSRKEGKRTFYTLNSSADEPTRKLIDLAVFGGDELPEHAEDQANLKRILALRDQHAQVYFNQVAGRFGRNYGPGRSWQAFGQMLLRVLPPLEIADLGSGEGLISELLARRARKVIAVDNSEKMVAFGRQKARENGLANLEFRHGDLEDPPIAEGSVDLVVLSQALHHAKDPGRALAGCHRILRPGGQVMVLDLLRHEFEQARGTYGDLWLGFKEGELHQWLERAGFGAVEVSVVAREEEPPHFTTLLACGRKRPAQGT